MKIAALPQMSPMDVRDLVGQIIDGGRESVLRGGKTRSGKRCSGKGYAVWSAGRGKSQAAAGKGARTRVRAGPWERFEGQGPEEGAVPF